MARKTGSRAEITGPLIRAAALRLFARHGYGAVSMRQIAAEVGVQAGALYLYTSDKQSLLFDLMRTHMEELLAAWALEPKGEEAPARLAAFARFHIRFHLERPEAVFLAYMELRALSDENFARIEALRQQYEAELADILRAGERAGQFHLADLRLTTMSIIAMLTGVNTWYKEGGRLSREAVGEIYADMVARLVAPERGSAPDPEVFGPR
ncbi:MAG TPA: TetR/AcrR family transcriptional regulator [Aliiroseovarius sp.]|nr:TetR/AcrR family transcriptional regulator [Aliiroseovarius sp.]